MRRSHKTTLTIALLLLSVCASAQETEEERAAREAGYRAAFNGVMNEVVEDMNRGSFERYALAIDQDDLFERIFGLRLISQRLKRDWREQQEEQFNNFIAGIYYEEAKDGLRATLLNVESRGTQGRAIVRFDMTFYRVNYIEYELEIDERGRVLIVDWIDYAWGHRFSEWAGRILVSAHPNDNAVRKLVDYPIRNADDLFQLTEYLKASRDFNLNRMTTIYNNLNDRLANQEVVIMVGLDLAKMLRKRVFQRTMLTSLAENFPDNPRYALSLLDYYIPEKRYEDAYNGLVRLRDHLRIDDAMMNARLSSITLVMDRVEDANALALRSVEQEPGLELGWWSVLRAKVAIGAFSDAVQALETLESSFGHTLGPDELGRDAAFRALLESPEYAEWLQTRG